MKNRELFADQEIINQMEKQFKEVGRDNDNWTVTYLDINTGENWLRHQVCSYLQGGGYPILARLPLADLEKLIGIALQSEDEDEVFATCLTLIDNEEVHGKKFRSELISKLEVLNDKQRRKRIIELTGLNSPYNRREVLGKRVTEIKSDSQHYTDIANRANKLLEKEA